MSGWTVDGLSHLVPLLRVGKKTRGLVQILVATSQQLERLKRSLIRDSPVVGIHRSHVFGAKDNHHIALPGYRETIYVTEFESQFVEHLVEMFLVLLLRHERYVAQQGPGRW